jgi:hypothetical protein
VKLALLAACASALVVGCSGGDRVADPFRQGVAGSRATADVVICDPTPSTCTRWVVLAPASGVAASELIQAVAAAAEQQLGWKPSRVPAEPAWQGLPFDGKTSGDGGFINSVRAQLAHASGDLDVGSSRKAGLQIIAAMQATPTGVVVRIMHNR